MGATFFSSPGVISFRVITHEPQLCLQDTLHSYADKALRRRIRSSKPPLACLASFFNSAAQILRIQVTVLRGGTIHHLVGSAAGGLVFQITCLEPSDIVAVKDSSHLPSIFGKSKTFPFFSITPSTCKEDTALRHAQDSSLLGAEKLLPFS